MSTLAHVRSLHRSNTFVITKNLEDVTHEESLAAPPTGGSCLNWVAGHILSTRNVTLRLLGEEPVWSDEELTVYARGTAPVTADTAADMARITGDLEATSQRIAAALDRAGEDDMTKKTPFPAVPGRDDISVGESLVGLAFHEAYHAGQLGILRRVAGKAGAIA